MAEGSFAENEDEFQDLANCLTDNDEFRGVPTLFPAVPSDEQEFDGIVDSDIEDDNEEEIEEDDEMPDFEEEVQTFRSKDGTIWTTKVPPQSRRVLASNLVSDDAHPKSVVPDDATMAKIFRLLFTDEILDMIVERSNEWGRFVVGQHNAREDIPKYEWKPIDRDELCAFIGLQIWLGMERNHKHPIDSLWSVDPLDRRPIFPATMGRDRFKTLTRVLRFDDAVGRRHRMAQDPSSVERGEPVQKLMEIFNRRTKELYEPGTHLTVDETLIPFRGRAPFRVYMKTKPGRYGLKLWNIADAKTSYVLGLQLYEGKRPGAPREYNQGKRVVLDLTRPFVGTNRSITTDNFFTSLSLAQDLAKDGLTLLGTIRKTRREVPVHLREKAGREEYSSIFVFHEYATLVSYKPRGSKDVVIVFSTEHHDKKVANDEERKPDMILAYNSTKGGVDTADQMISEYTSQRPTRRWPMKLFYALIDVASINSYKILSLKKQVGSRMASMRELALDLMWNQHQRRSSCAQPPHICEALDAVETSRGMPLSRITQAIPVDPRPVPEAGGPARRRCELCEGPVHRRPLSRTTCNMCFRFVCADHKLICCTECRPPLPPIHEELVLDDDE